MGRNKVHGMSKTRFYRIWSGMKVRCNNPLERAYFQRGIKVCERWGNFLNFKDDMYESYLQHCIEHGEKNTSIERKDVNGNYEPSNCKWATREEQDRNKQDLSRKKKVFHVDGKDYVEGEIYKLNNVCVSFVSEESNQLNIIIHSKKSKHLNSRIRVFRSQFKILFLGK